MKVHTGSRHKLYFSVKFALDGGELLMPCPGHFTPSNDTQYPLHKTLGGPQCQSGWVEKISPPMGFELWTVQPIAMG